MEPITDKNGVEIKEGYFVLYKGKQKVVSLLTDMKIGINDLVIFTENGITFLSAINKEDLLIPEYQELR